MFCRECLIDLNATQAAIRAGYSEKTANEQGAQNLAKLSIQSRIAELKEQRNDLVGINAIHILKRPGGVSHHFCHRQDNERENA